MSMLAAYARTRLRIFTHFFFVVLGCLAVTVQARAAYPDRPIVIISPLPAGGANDTITRIFAQELSKRLGQQVITENRSGAGGNLGTQAAARATADGHTLVMAPAAPVVINQYLYSNLGYDPIKDLAPIALIADVPIVLAMNPALGIKNLQGLVDVARNKPGTLSFGTPGVGSVQHLTGELLKKYANIDIVHVPYRGGAPAMNDVLSGHIQILIDSLPGSIGQIKEGALRGVAIAGSVRNPQLPDVATVAEQGFPGFAASTWFALFAPSGTTPDILKRLTDETRFILQQPGFAAQIQKLGAETGTLVGADMTAFVGAETKKWKNVIEEAGIKAP